MPDLLPSEVLSRAADLIEPEGAWTQAARGRTKRGKITPPTNRYATCWCLIGAIQRVAKRGDRSGVDPYEAREVGFVKTVLGGVSFGWNDARGRTQAEVVQALRDASALAQSEGK